MCCQAAAVESRTGLVIKVKVAKLRIQHQDHFRMICISAYVGTSASNQQVYPDIRSPAAAVSQTHNSHLVYAQRAHTHIWKKQQHAGSG